MNYTQVKNIKWIWNTIGVGHLSVGSDWIRRWKYGTKGGGNGGDHINTNGARVGEDDYVLEMKAVLVKSLPSAIGTIQLGIMWAAWQKVFENIGVAILREKH